MEIDEKTIQELRSMGARKAYESVRRAVLGNLWGASSEDLHAAMVQLVEAGVLSWDEIEQFEES